MRFASTLGGLGTFKRIPYNAQQPNSINIADIDKTKFGIYAIIAGDNVLFTGSGDGFLVCIPYGINNSSSTSYCFVFFNNNGDVYSNVFWYGTERGWKKVTATAV